MLILWKLFRACHRAALPGPWNAWAMRCWLRTKAGAEWRALAQEQARSAQKRQQAKW